LQQQQQQQGVSRAVHICRKRVVAVRQRGRMEGLERHSARGPAMGYTVRVSAGRKMMRKAKRRCSRWLLLCQKAQAAAAVVVVVVVVVPCLSHLLAPAQPSALQLQRQPPALHARRRSPEQHHCRHHPYKE
jgi:hypothetical protein